MFVRNALVVLALAGGVVAIGGATACSSDPEGDKYPSAESFCTAKAEAECTKGAELCGATLDKCKTSRKTICVNAANTSTNSGRAYRAANAEACLTKVTEVYKDLPITAEKEAPLTAACERVFVGTKTKAQPCQNTYDCESANHVCDKGFCAEKVEKNESDGCSNAGEVCKTGFACKPEGGQRFCRARQTEGSICDGERLCLEALRCNGQCVARKGSGQDCGANDECATGYCSLDKAEKKCAAKLVTESGQCKDFGT